MFFQQFLSGCVQVGRFTQVLAIRIILSDDASVFIELVV